MGDNTLFSLASFAIAAIGVAATVLAFMLIENKAVRYASGSACLLLTILFSIVGLSSFLNVDRANTLPETVEIVLITPTTDTPTSTNTPNLSAPIFTHTPQPAYTWTPTFTPVPPTNTPIPPANTPVPPTFTSVPSTPPPPPIWQHNPSLSPPEGYPGAIKYTKQDFPGSSEADWVYGVEVSTTSEQILLIAGYAGYVPEIGDLGKPTNCFLLIARGPINSKVDLLAAGLEVHDVTSSANPLIWAAQKVTDLREANTTCAQGIDLWIKN